MNGMGDKYANTREITSAYSVDLKHNPMLIANSFTSPSIYKAPKALITILGEGMIFTSEYSDALTHKKPTIATQKNMITTLCCFDIFSKYIMSKINILKKKRANRTSFFFVSLFPLESPDNHFILS